MAGTSEIIPVGFSERNTDNLLVITTAIVGTELGGRERNKGVCDMLENKKEREAV